MISIQITSFIQGTNRIPPMRGVLDTTLCHKICQWLAAGRWFSPGTPVFSTNKTDRHDIAKILLKVALNTITLTRIFQNLNNCLLFRYIRFLMISIYVTSFIQGTYDFGDHSSDYGCNSCHRYNKFHTPNVLHWIFVAQMDWYTHACKTKIKRDTIHLHTVTQTDMI